MSSGSTSHPLGLALQAHRAGRLAEAEQGYRETIRWAEANRDTNALLTACCNLAALVSARRQWGEAEDLFRRALSVVPEHPDLHFSLAYTLQEQGRMDAAEQAYRAVLARKPDHAMAVHNLGLLLQPHQPEAAEAIYRQALMADPDHLATLVDLGNLLRSRKRYQEAGEIYRRILAIQPGHVETWNNLGNTLLELKRLDDAEAAYLRALELKPGHVSAINNLGALLLDRRRFDEAEALLKQAVAAWPDHIATHNNLGNLYLKTKQLDLAESAYRRTLALDPGNGGTHYNLGCLFKEGERFQEAEAAFRRVVELEPEHEFALSDWLSMRLKLCRWDDELTSFLNPGNGDELARRLTPFTALMLRDDPAFQLTAATRAAEKAAHGVGEPLWRGERYPHERIRLAYLSADLHEHATAYLMAELFETHDRERFEVFAFSWGPDHPSPMRQRLKQAFDHFEDVATLDDDAVARRLRELEIDIAVDLKGYTKDSRPGILARRPAPVQVNYLGFPGTLGADNIDYILVDTTLVPETEFPYYREKVVRLPDCYQTNDRHRAIAPETPSRHDCGLPEKGFVFCCFNNFYKITPTVFAVWMRLLREVPGSVLWLLEDNPWTRENLLREVSRAGLDPARLVFAPRTRLPEHLARHRLADLFIDAFPVCAHTTASDALWAGLPVLTRMGRGFASRVAGSLLRAIGLPELVTTNLADYEAMALHLARHPEALADIRTRLAHNRLSSPLFDTDRFRRHIEAAYLTMWQRARQGLAPDHFDVPVS